MLAGLSLIQYLNWKREKSVKNELMDQEFVSEEIEAYSRRSAKLGFIGAASSLVVTRNPLVSLGILLAANPRPITVSTEYAWKQAEHVANENKQAIPINGSIYQLAQTKCIVFEEASLLAVNGTIRKQFIPVLTQLAGGKVAVVNNELKMNLTNLEKSLREYGVQLTSHQDMNMNAREEVLVVVKDQAIKKNNVISFYPYCTIGQLSSIGKTIENSKGLQKIIKRNMLITRIWNVVGSIIAIPMFISAPLINLIGDALSLSFMSNAKNWTERRFAPSHGKQVELH